MVPTLAELKRLHTVPLEELKYAPESYERTLSIDKRGNPHMDCGIPTAHQ